jgi:hypothetical protein
MTAALPMELLLLVQAVLTRCSPSGADQREISFRG